MYPFNVSIKAVGAVLENSCGSCERSSFTIESACMDSSRKRRFLCAKLLNVSFPSVWTTNVTYNFF